MSTNFVVFDGFLSVAGCELEIVHVPAAASQPTIVFLHEGLGSVELWRDFPRSLARKTGCGMLVYSRHGNGRSEPLDRSRPVTYMHDEALVVLPELLRQRHIERPVLFGHSDGASIALIFAGASPMNVRALVLEAPHLMVEPLSIASIAAIRDAYVAGPLRERMARYHVDVDRTFFGWNDIWLDAQFASWNIEEAVRAVVVPVLAIQGSEDEYGTLAQIDKLARCCAGAVDRMILSGCGHAPHRARRTLVEETATAWLADVLRMNV